MLDVFRDVVRDCPVWQERLAATVVTGACFAVTVFVIFIMVADFLDLTWLSVEFWQWLGGVAAAGALFGGAVGFDHAVNILECLWGKRRTQWPITLMLWGAIGFWSWWMLIR